MSRRTRQIYMDYASATPVDKRVSKIMQRFSSEEFGNPGSIHSMGLNARRAVEDSRKRIADVLNCLSDEIIFTSGGTEGDNLAVLGIAKGRRGGHIITTAIEHQAILAPCRALEDEGFKVTYLPMSPGGFVNLGDVKKALRPDTFLVSIMYANNEIGTIQPIADIAKVIRNYRKSNSQSKIYFHTDACQAPGALSLNVAKLGVDLMTLSGAKMYGPKGVGCLYVKRQTPLSPIIYGGGQEKGIRSGTENVAGIVGMAEALVNVDKIKEKECERVRGLRDYLAERILEAVPRAEINGEFSYWRRLPNNLNIFIPGIENEQLVIELDAIGVAVSSGSACNTDVETGSHVLKALGHNDKRVLGSVRFSLGKSNAKKDIDYLVKRLPEIIGRISNSGLLKK